MDGAARFNQRDSMATILITAINIIAGLLIGVLQQGADLGDGGKDLHHAHGGGWPGHDDSFLLVSVAGGMVLTRASSRVRSIRRSVRSFWAARRRFTCAAACSVCWLWCRVCRSFRFC